MSATEHLLHRADALLREGDVRGAADLYRLTLDRAPRNPDALAGLGRVFLASGQAAPAVTALGAALLAAPHRLDIRADLAVAQARNGAPALALVTAEDLPPTEGALEFRARQLEALGRRDDALALLDDALTHDAASLALRRLAGALARRAERWTEAETHWRRLTELAPTDAAAWSSLGNTLAALGRDTEAEAALRRALDLAPGEADWWYNLAHHLIARNRLEEALGPAERATTLAPDRAHAWTNLGVCRLGLGDVAGALAAHETAIRLDPNEPEARYDLAWAQLTAGLWREGWANHEARWAMPRFTSRRAPPPGRPWDGAPLAPGETLLLHAEQGLGDSLMMARLLPATLDRARSRAGAQARVVLECPATLSRLFETLPGLDAVAPRAETPPEADAQAALMSLPHLLDVTAESIPGAPPWLIAPPHPPWLIAPPPPPIAAVDGPRVGVVWRGAPENRMDILRSCPPEALAPLFALDHVRWISLQWGAAEPPHPAVAPGLLGARDMADTAAVLRTLDLVIGVDTSVVHLAGALGLEAWVLLARVPDYRWMLDREDSPWYPTLRLFRQTRRGEWGPVVTRVVEALTGRFPPRSRSPWITAPHR
jgi:Flp pilus assembly protein TadD